jgi:hypothetical protein
MKRESTELRKFNGKKLARIKCGYTPFTFVVPSEHTCYATQSVALLHVRTSISITNALSVAFIFISSKLKLRQM